MYACFLWLIVCRPKGRYADAISVEKESLSLALWRDDVLTSFLHVRKCQILQSQRLCTRCLWLCWRDRLHRSRKIHIPSTFLLPSRIPSCTWQHISNVAKVSKARLHKCYTKGTFSPGFGSSLGRSRRIRCPTRNLHSLEGKNAKNETEAPLYQLQRLNPYHWLWPPYKW